MRQKRKEEKEFFDTKDSEKKEQSPWERMRLTGNEKMAPQSKWNLTFSFEQPKNFMFFNK